MSWDDLNEASQKAYAADQYLEAQSLLEKALKEADKDAHRQAITLSRIGKVHLVLNDHAKAESVLTKALALSGKSLGLEHEEVARVIDQLGTAYSHQHKFQEAESLLNRGLEMRKKLLGEEHPEVAESLVSLGSLHSAQKNYSQAETALRQALELQEKFGGGVAESETLGLLALLYLRQGNYEDAERLAAHAAQLRETALGPEHPDLAMSLHIFAMVLAAEKRYDEALAQYMRVLTIRSKTLPREHPLVTTVVKAVGMLYMRRRQYAEAQSVFEDLERLTEGGGAGEDHQLAMLQLSWLYVLQRQFDAGQIYISKAIRGLNDADPTAKRTREKMTISLFCCQVGRKDYVAAVKTLPTAARIFSRNRGTDKLLLKQGLQSGLYAVKRD